MRSHERFVPLHEVKTSSDRSSGIVFGVVLLLIALFPLAIGEARIPIWALAGSVLFFAAAAFAPKALSPLNRLWTRFGLLLQMIVNPIVLGIMFFFVVLPTGLLIRLLGKDPLRLRFDEGAPMDPAVFIQDSAGKLPRPILKGK